jgi:hypothetical protein
MWVLKHFFTKILDATTKNSKEIVEDGLHQLHTMEIEKWHTKVQQQNMKEQYLKQWDKKIHNMISKHEI